MPDTGLPYDDRVPRVFCFGSLNMDHVYAVDRFARPGETLTARSYRRFCGGKGLNQSVALARAGARAVHAGRVGRDGLWLKDRLAAWGVDVALVAEDTDTPTGHAVIQVAADGQNAIVLYGGANRAIAAADADRVLAAARPGDWLLLQNEISFVSEILKRGASAGLIVAFNPAPMTPDVPNMPLERLRYLIVNEIEGQDLTGESNPARILDGLRKRCPTACVALTLGADGVLAADGKRVLSVPAEPVRPVDTTAAGDTFTGFFLAARAQGMDLEAALRLATRAAALCVGRPGAAESIPTRAEADAMAGPAGG